MKLPPLLRVSREGLAWSRRSWLGEQKLAAAEIEELYVSGKVDLVALSDRKQLIMEMEVTPLEGAWLRDQVVARFGDEDKVRDEQASTVSQNSGNE